MKRGRPKKETPAITDEPVVLQSLDDEIICTAQKLISLLNEKKTELRLLNKPIARYLHSILKIEQVIKAMQ